LGKRAIITRAGNSLSLSLALFKKDGQEAKADEIA
jgi:hypothetical protein